MIPVESIISNAALPPALKWAAFLTTSENYWKASVCKMCCLVTNHYSFHCRGGAFENCSSLVDIMSATKLYICNYRISQGPVLHDILSSPPKFCVNLFRTSTHQTSSPVPESDHLGYVFALSFHASRLMDR